jgi:hypothetical protein
LLRSLPVITLDHAICRQQRFAFHRFSVRATLCILADRMDRRRLVCSVAWHLYL